MKKFLTGIFILMLSLTAVSSVNANTAQPDFTGLVFEKNNEQILLERSTYYELIADKKFNRKNFNSLKYLKLNNDKYYAYSTYLEMLANVSGDSKISKGKRFAETIKLVAGEKDNPLTSVTLGSANEEGIIESQSFRVLNIQ